MFTKTDASKIAKLERKLSDICREIYELDMGSRRFIPRVPYVLVRVLPKEHIVGGIILAETAQNKIVYEGIVIATWEPYTETRHKSNGMGGHDEFVIHHKCGLVPGQRICFPHYEGIAVGEYLDDKYYRLVRESSDQNRFPYMGVYGVLDYQGDVEAAAKIRKLTKDMTSITTSGLPYARGANPNEEAR